MGGGRVEGEGSGAGSMTFTDVEDRLVEAMLTCWRHADRERGWQQLRSAWPDISRDVLAGDYDARGGLDAGDQPTLKPASLTRREVAEMEEAFGWLDAVDPADRKVIGLAVAQLASGKREISWTRMMPRLGLERGADGLRMRYGRAIAAICERETRRNAGHLPVNRVNLPD